MIYGFKKIGWNRTRHDGSQKAHDHASWLASSWPDKPQGQAQEVHRMWKHDKDHL
jgi:hypothetical protein